MTGGGARVDAEVAELVTDLRHRRAVDDLPVGVRRMLAPAPARRGRRKSGPPPLRSRLEAAVITATPAFGFLSTLLSSIRAAVTLPFAGGLIRPAVSRLPPVEGQPHPEDEQHAPGEGLDRRPCARSTKTFGAAADEPRPGAVPGHAHDPRGAT